MKKIVPILALLLTTTLDANIAPPQSETKQAERPLGTSGYTLKKGKIISNKDKAWLSPQEHYSLGKDAFEKNNYKLAAKHFRVVVAEYLDSPFGQDSLYYCAYTHFITGDYEKANIAATEYLNNHSNLKYFEDVLQLKLQIGDAYKNGAKTHLFDLSLMPKWGSGDEEAIKIYSEIITTIPSHPIAAKAYLAKGDLHKKNREWKPAIDSYQAVISRFPKHDFAPEAYKSLIDLYLIRAKGELNNPDLLALAEVQLNRFSNTFPTHPQLPEIRAKYIEIQEVYAQGLFETAQFYERTKKEKASLLYYHVALKQFPNTNTATLCRQKLDDKKDLVAEMQLDGELPL